MSEDRSKFGNPLPASLPLAHARIFELEEAMMDVLRMLRVHAYQLGTSGNPKTRARIDRAQEILQQESLQP